MNDYVAQALMDIGKSLPSQLRQNRIDSQAMRDKRRQYMSDDLANELSSLQIQSAKNKIAEDETNQANNRAALDSLAEATKAMQRNKQFTDLNELEEKAGLPKADYGLKSNRDIFTNYALPKFSGDKRVDDFYKMNVEDVEKQQKAGLTPGSLRIGNRAGLIEDYRRPEMKDFVKKKLEEFKNKTGLDDDTYNGKLSAIDAGEGYNVSEFIDDYYSQGQKNKQRVDLENDLIGPRAKTAGATNYAGKTGDLKAGKDAPKTLGMEGIDPNTGTTFSAQQKQDAAFAIKLNRANNVLDDLVGDLDESAIDKAILSNVDNNGFIRTNVINQIKDPKLRQYAQAKLDFVLSTLRKESGAAISAQEYVGQAARYFAQAGDDPETLSQKRNARIDEEANYRASAGDAAYNYFMKSQKKIKEEKPNPYKKPNPVNEALGKVSQQKIDLAKQALNDPEATSDEKARAMVILRNAGVQ